MVQKCWGFFVYFGRSNRCGLGLAGTGRRLGGEKGTDSIESDLRTLIVRSSVRVRIFSSFLRLVLLLATLLSLFCLNLL